MMVERVHHHGKYMALCLMYHVDVDPKDVDAGVATV